MKFNETTLVKISFFALGALALYVVAGLFSGNWNPFTAGTVEVLDANGNPTRRILTVKNPNVYKQRACCSANGGFIGNCKYPITSDAQIPSCR